MFSTGILAKVDAHQIMLYFNGIHHAGENLDKLLSKRTTKDTLMLMSDALSGPFAPSSFLYNLC
jgi:hypothetical protein